MSSTNEITEGIRLQSNEIAKFREQIAGMREELDRVRSEISEEKRRREEASFANEKLLELNSKLIEQIKLLKQEKEAKHQNDKMLELQRKLDVKNEIVQLMRRKHVTDQRKKMTLTTSSEFPFKLIISEQSIVINPGEKDSGLEMTQPKKQLINGIMELHNSFDAGEETRKGDMAEDNLLEKKDEMGAKGKEMKVETVILQKSEDDSLEEEIERIATDLANGAISKGVQYLRNEREIKMRSEIESLQKKLETALEGNVTLQQQAFELNAKIEESKKKHEQAFQDKEMAEIELREVKKSKDELEMENKRAFDEEVDQLKVKNDQLNEDLNKALQDKQKADEDIEKLKKMQEAKEVEREREFGELCSKMNIEQDALKKNAEDLELDLKVQKEESEEIEMKYLSMKNKLGKLKEDHSKTLTDLVEDIKLKEDEIILNKELTSNIRKLKAENENLEAENIQLTMQKNNMEIRNKEFEKGYQEQEVLLQKAQNSLREMTEEDYQRRLRKRRRRGWRKLKFWL